MVLCIAYDLIRNIVMLNFIREPQRMLIKQTTLLIACALPLASLAASRDTGASKIDVFSPVTAHFPKDCKDTVLGRSGLCLIASTSPKVKNTFLVRPVDANWQMVGQAQGVPYNRFLPLQPGHYLLYSSSGMDNLHESRLTITQGQTSMVKTATLKFAPADGKSHRLQHYQSTNGINGRGCTSEIVRNGARAVLAGNYQVNLMDKKTATGPMCLSSGVTVNAMAGTAQAGRPRRTKDQTLPANNTYTHPNGKSSLASISHFMADVERLSILPEWKSFRAIHNPHHTHYNALILSGIGTQHFVIPFKTRNRKRECGLSLAMAGLPSHVLLTDCQFKGNKLTGFRVQPGSFYTFNNRHGKTSIEGNYINNPIRVQNVRFSLN